MRLLELIAKILFFAFIPLSSCQPHQSINITHKLEFKFTNDHENLNNPVDFLSNEVSSSIYSHIKNNLTDIMIIGTLEGNVYAYDLTNDRELWRINLGKPLISSEVDFRVYFYCNFLSENRGHLPNFPRSRQKHILHRPHNKHIRSK